MARAYLARDKRRTTRVALLVRAFVACSLAVIVCCPGTSRADDANKPLSFDYEWFFLQSDNPNVETVPLLVNRPSTNSDRYLVGYDTSGAPLFENFDLAVGANKPPGDPLYELLRDTSSYNRPAFACNAQTPDTIPSDSSCKLSNGEVSGHAFVEGRSLLGPLQLTIR